MTNINKIITCSKSKLPKILNKEQLIKMLGQVDSPHVAMGMFLSIFFGTRISEISYVPRKRNHVLKWNDVNLNHGEITILDAKNTKRYKSGYGKDRIVPIFDEFIHIFKLWHALYPDSEYVIPHQKGKNEPINVRQLQDKTTEALDKAGLLEVESYQRNNRPRYKYHFHTFRHVCATNLLRRGLPIEQVKEFLGHERLETTMVYLNIVKDDLKESVTQAYAY
ncbi:MAG: site-specific integrase, partial [archaeon]